jgi:hypothetical protein
MAGGGLWLALSDFLCRIVQRTVKYHTGTVEPYRNSINNHQCDVSDLDSFSTPQLFYTYFYNHAHRLRLEQLLYLEPSRIPNGFF